MGAVGSSLIVLLLDPKPNPCDLGPWGWLKPSDSRSQAIAVLAPYPLLQETLLSPGYNGCVLDVSAAMISL